eukprot:m.332010 g.332010  ORF g.332010 m.332010 type:complete len:760 (+) comp16056_c0_seq17:492-2771(+)
MYGFLHSALVAWVRQRSDAEALMAKLLEALEDHSEGRIDDFFAYYPDTMTFLFLGTLSKLTGVKPDDLKFEAGVLSVNTFVETGYLPMLKALGPDLFTVIDNLDSMHDNFLAAFPKMRTPSVRPERESEDSFLVHYFSQREGLAPFMMGALKGLAALLFDLDVDITHRSKKGMKGATHDVFRVFLDDVECMHREEDLTAYYMQTSMSKDMIHQLFPWHIEVDANMTVQSIGTHISKRLKENPIGKKLAQLIKISRPVDATIEYHDLKTRTGVPVMMSINKSCLIKDGEMAYLPEANACPFSRQAVELLNAGAVDAQEKSMLSGHTGMQLNSRTMSARSSVQVEPQGVEAVTIQEDDGASKVEVDLRKLPTQKAPSRGRSRANTANSRVGELPSITAISCASSVTSGSRMSVRKAAEQIILHGELILNAENGNLFFAASPAISDMAAMQANGMSLDELPIHSHGREMLFSAMFQSISAATTADFEKKVQHLDETMQQVNQRKLQIDTLLHSILPRDVAESLAVGMTPKADSFDSVTVLFSSITGFANISSDVPPTEVMEMLNDLFVKFDRLCDVHDVYKVETIRDSYMVAAGCPEVTSDHALKIANFALEMVPLAATVISPLDGDPIRIKVGIHSGPLMAGVVGKSRPRYCLFGDTVNVASQIENTGVTNTVQGTFRFVRCLPEDFVGRILPRGFVSINGKGSIKTFFIVGDDPDMRQAVVNELSKTATIKEPHQSSQNYAQLPPSLAKMPQDTLAIHGL